MKKLHDLIFGPWQEASIKKVIELDEPGVYLLRARTFGFSGWFGGTHSWIVHISLDGSRIVAEVTDLASLKHQGATWIEMLRRPTCDDEKLVFLSDREGGQKWFGSRPIVTYLGKISRKELLEIVIAYPLFDKKFRLLDLNCNTFASWVIYNMKVRPKKIGIGAKTVEQWKQDRINK